MAGLLKKGSGHVSEGSVTYNGDPPDSSQFSLPKVAHFAEQVMIDEQKGVTEMTDENNTRCTVPQKLIGQGQPERHCCCPSRNVCKLIGTCSTPTKLLSSFGRARRKQRRYDI